MCSDEFWIHTIWDSRRFDYCSNTGFAVKFHKWLFFFFFLIQGCRRRILFCRYVRRFKTFQPTHLKQFEFQTSYSRKINYLTSIEIGNQNRLNRNSNNCFVEPKSYFSQTLICLKHWSLNIWLLISIARRVRNKYLESVGIFYG